MTSFAPRPRLRRKVKHILFSGMLCCGKRKEGGVVGRGAEVESRRGIVLQPDFRRISGISNEIFRQLEAVDLDAAQATARAQRAGGTSGEMVLRIFDPCALGRVGAESYRKYLSLADATHIVRFVEIIKRPGQTLGLYIREGDGLRETEGVFISRIALESAVYNSGLLRVGDEIVAVNLVEVRGMSLDDVVIVMSIPRRLLLTIRSTVYQGASRVRQLTAPPGRSETTRHPVVHLIKTETSEEGGSNGENSENGHLIRARTKGLPPEIPAIAVKLNDRDHVRERRRYDTTPQHHYANTTARGGQQQQQHLPIAHHHHPYHQPPPTHQQYTATTRREEPPQRWVVTQQPKPYVPPQQERYEPHHRRTRSMVPPTRGREVGATAPLRRSTGMLRHESYATDYSTAKPQQQQPATNRRSLYATTTMHRGRTRRGGYDDSSHGILRRRTHREDSSVSDTEVGGTRGRADWRSHSLPRPSRGGVGVRFTTHLPYDSSQEESDGAVSAPELPAPRRTYPRTTAPPTTSNVFTSDEYAAWMSRAPSTSVIYERLRRGRHHNAALRVAYSAESILDATRKEEFRGIYTFPRRLHTPLSEDELLPGGRGGLRSAPHPTQSSHDRLHLLSLDPADFNKYRMVRSSAHQTPPGGGYSGLLWVHLLSGRGLRGGAGHFRDLYCVIECDSAHKARTVIRTGEHSFDWDEVFEIDLVQCREVAFLLYSWDPRFRHKLCYRGHLHLGALLRESPIHSLALKLEPRGTLYLKMRYKGPETAFVRRQHSEGVFGVDLETLLVREDSGFTVPLIIKRCTEEVEKRGLDIVGIYRLCGSALRKRLLKEEFERNTLTADLSVEHVPDINVVTSLLKDYLRELPEPLLSKSLYEMLVDGLSVCLPDDPQGSAKLMFSILECLPKANLCTVLHLLDHLRLISSHSDRNKMSATSLATAFGPVLACHQGTPLDIRRPIDVVAFLVEMWPAKRTSWSTSSGSSGNSWDSSLLTELLESLEAALTSPTHP